PMPERTKEKTMMTMTTFANSRWCRLAAAGLMLAVGLGSGAPAAMAEDIDFLLPAVIATAVDKVQINAVYYPFPIVPSPHFAFSRDDHSIGNPPTSSGAQAAATLDGYMVMAHSSAGLASAEAYMDFSVEDPQA